MPVCPTLTLGIVTDLHFGPEARFRGKLRKLSHHAARLTEAFVDRMNGEVMPDLIVNLGDDIEDENREADRARYAQCQSILRKAHAPLLNVAGNHDLVNLTRGDLAASWGREGPLYYALDHEGSPLAATDFQRGGSPLAATDFQRGGSPLAATDFQRRGSPLAATDFQRRGWHFVVLHTIERKDQDIRIPRPQLEWLREDLHRT